MTVSPSLAAYLRDGPHAAAEADRDDVYLDRATGDLVVKLANGLVARFTPAGGLVLPAALAGVGLDVVAALSAAAPASFLVNGGHEVWQRGTGPFTATAAYAADRWQIALGGSSTLSIARDVADPGNGSQYATGFTYVHVAAGSASYAQRVEGFEQLRGSTVTFSALVQSSVAGTVRLRVNDGTTNYDGPYNVGTGLEVLSVTVPIPAGASDLSVRARWDVASCTGRLDNCALRLGSAVGTWRPSTPPVDLAACQRYYLEMGGLDANEVITVGHAISATSVFSAVRLPVEMFAAPTVTVSAAGDFAVLDSAGGVQVCTSAVAGVVTRRSLRLTLGVAAGLTAGAASYVKANGTTAARLKFEANP